MFLPKGLLDSQERHLCAVALTQHDHSLPAKARLWQINRKAGLHLCSNQYTLRDQDAYSFCLGYLTLFSEPIHLLIQIKVFDLKTSVLFISPYGLSFPKIVIKTFIAKLYLFLPHPLKTSYTQISQEDYNNCSVLFLKSLQT